MMDETTRTTSKVEVGEFCGNIATQKQREMEMPTSSPRKKKQMTNETNNTNAMIDGEFEVFKVTIGVRPNLTYSTEWWLKNNWRTIERLVMDKDCVLSYKEYEDVLQGHSSDWDGCFDDKSLWQKFIDEQKERGAWVEDDEQVILELITRYAHKLDERRAFDIDEYSINRTLCKIKQKIESGYSIAWCRLQRDNLYIQWVRTSREKSNAFDICDQICAIIKSLMRKGKKRIGKRKRLWEPFGASQAIVGDGRTWLVVGYMCIL